MRTFEVLKPMGFRRRGEQGLTSYLPGELVKLSDKQAALFADHVAEYKKPKTKKTKLADKAVDTPEEVDDD